MKAELITKESRELAEDLDARIPDMGPERDPTLSLFVLPEKRQVLVMFRFDPAEHNLDQILETIPGAVVDLIKGAMAKKARRLERERRDPPATSGQADRRSEG